MSDRRGGYTPGTTSAVLRIDECLIKPADPTVCTRTQPEHLACWGGEHVPQYRSIILPGYGNMRTLR